MLKEILAASIIAALIALSVFDVHYSDKMIGELIAMVDAAENEADVESALQFWEGEKWFTYIVIRHSEIDLVTTEFYALRRDISGKDSALAKERMKSKLNCIREMEQVTIGTIF
ncbi:MAG: DUF4363 family protein [Oscillospiraceae bacterium]|nr:DUF4363 family protein [Oscillospiraceae bacterium]